MTVWVLYLVIIVVLILAIVLFLVNQKMFNPKTKILRSPTGEYHDIYMPINNKHGHGYRRSEKPNIPCINGWHFTDYGSESERTILYLHGNIGNNSHRDYVVNICKNLKINLFLVDYRGFGRSNKHPTPKGICEDAEAAYKYLQKQVGDDNIILWGESLGGAAAVWAASKYRCSALVLMATFSSTDDVLSQDPKGGKSSKWIAKLVAYATNTLPSKQWIRKVRSPIVILHSQEDDMIPYKCAEILYEAAEKCKHKLLITIKGGHSSPEISKEQFKELLHHCRLDSRECSSRIPEMMSRLRKAGQECFSDYA